MISIQILRASRNKAAQNYYLNLASEDYYVRGGEPPGVWMGSGIAHFGLSGKVTREDMERFFKTLSEPEIGADGKPKPQKNIVNGIDLVGTAPKPFSVLWATGSEEVRKQCDAIHAAAIKETVEFIEREFAWSRIGRGGSNFVRAKLAIAAFTHGTNRNLDANKHTHLVVMNQAVCPDGEVRAVYADPLLENQHLFGAIYRNALARGIINELGLELEQDRDEFWNIKIVPKKLVKDSSSRREQLLAELRRVGEKGGRAKQIASKRTAKWKGLLPPRKELLQVWGDKSALYGFTADKIDAAIAKGKAKQQPRPTKKVIDEALKTALSKTLNESMNSFKEFDFQRWVIAGLGYYGLAEDELVRIVDDFLHQNKDIVQLKTHFNQRFFSTKEILAQEQATIDVAKRLDKKRSYPVLQETTERYIAEEQARLAKHGHELDPEQLQAIRKLTSNHGNMRLLSGIAGGGKTTVLNTVAKIYQAEGYNVVGMAPTNRAKNQLLEDNDEIGTHTVTKALGDWELPTEVKIEHYKQTLVRMAGAIKWNLTRKRKKRRGLWWKKGKSWPRTWSLPQPKELNLKKGRTVAIVDESSMVGTRQMLKLLRYIENNDALVILVGDDKQIQSLERGGSFHAMLKLFVHSKMTKARRQRHEWGREMVEELFNGNVSDALTLLRENGEVVGKETVPELIEKSVEQWARWGIAAPEQTALLCLENDQVFQANKQCQAKRKAAGHLGKSSIDVVYEAGKGDAKKSYEEKVYVGDKVVFRGTSEKKGYVKNQDGIVKSIKGKKVIVELNGKTDAKGKPIRVDVRFRKEELSPVSLCYAGTNFKAQGASVEHVVCMLSGTLVDKENCYVALSRFRENLVLLTLNQHLENFADNVEDSPICKAMLKSRIKEHAMDMIPEQTLDAPHAATLEEWKRYYRRMKQQADSRRREQESEERKEIDKALEIVLARDVNGFLFSDFTGVESNGNAKPSPNHEIDSTDIEQARNQFLNDAEAILGRKLNADEWKERDFDHRLEDAEATAEMEAHLREAEQDYNDSVEEQKQDRAREGYILYAKLDGIYADSIRNMPEKDFQIHAQQMSCVFAEYAELQNLRREEAEIFKPKTRKDMLEEAELAELIAIHEKEEKLAEEKRDKEWKSYLNSKLMERFARERAVREQPEVQSYRRTSTPTDPMQSFIPSSYTHSPPPSYSSSISTPACNYSQQDITHAAQTLLNGHGWHHQQQNQTTHTNPVQNTSVTYTTKRAN